MIAQTDPQGLVLPYPVELELVWPVPPHNFSMEVVGKGKKRFQDRNEPEESIVGTNSNRTVRSSNRVEVKKYGFGDDVTYTGVNMPVFQMSLNPPLPGDGSAQRTGTSYMVKKARYNFKYTSSNCTADSGNVILYRVVVLWVKDQIGTPVIDDYMNLPLTGNWVLATYARNTASNYTVLYDTTGAISNGNVTVNVSAGVNIGLPLKKIVKTTVFPNRISTVRPNGYANECTVCFFMTDQLSGDVQLQRESDVEFIDV